MPAEESSSHRSAAVSDAPYRRSQRLFSGLRIVSLLTFLSRILGLVRDIGMAALFGAGPLMDAFSVAFRIPNLSRRLFGEGALTAAFLPVFVREMEQTGAESAWKVASALLTLLAMWLSGLVLLAEFVLWGLSFLCQPNSEAALLIGLTAVMLPYLVLICLAAQLSAILHALGHFTWPALVPIVMNLIWIAGIWIVAPLFDSKTAQIYAIACCIVVAGILQLAAPWPALRRLGFRYQRAWQSSRGQVAEIGRTMLPVVVGLSITQLNTIADSLIAWGFAAPESGPATISLLGGIRYPLVAGTASELYFAQRTYQFPLGVFGVALGTVLFPLLSRHAERGRLDLLRDDLSLGIRLVLCIGLPASLGLMLLAQPLTVLLFQHGAFDDRASAPMAGMVSAYGIAVWAYCGLLIIHRGYYAMGDARTPLRVGIVTFVFNLILNFTLIWYIGGRGLALGTALSAIVQVIAVTWLIQSRIGRLDWTALAKTTGKVLLATVVMGTVCIITLEQMPAGKATTDRLLAVFVPLTSSLVVYFAMARLIGLDELWLLFKRDGNPSDENHD